MQNFYVLENTIQTYVWGSFDGIPAFTGIVNTDDEPMAELWMGAHPGAPSRILTEKNNSVSLDKFIKENPEAILGLNILKRFGPSLPFLFKILSASSPLSLQVHPSKNQAETGYERENLAGIPILSPIRNYKDTNRKPEIIMALTHFTALCGFRKPEDTARLLACSDSNILSRAAKILASEGYVRFCHFLLELTPDEKQTVIHDAIETAAKIAKTKTESDITESYALLTGLASRFTNDIGILAPLYLNIIILEPGEALYFPSGIMHTYIKGTGLELMASSDNTLRGGLTAKHIDIPELLSVLDPSPYLPSKMHIDTNCGISSYKTPSDDFELSVARLEDSTAEFIANGPSIIIGSTGKITASADAENDSCKISRGTIIFIPASGKRIELKGKGICYIASMPASGAIG